MKRFAVALFALSLGGCATIEKLAQGIPNPVSADRVVLIKSGYGVALSAAVAYRDSCAQRLIPPSCRTIVPQIVLANRKVEVALARLESLRKLGPTIDLTEAIGALSDAVNDLKILTPGN